MSNHALDRYLADCSALRSTKSLTPETSLYPAIEALLASAGGSLKPRVYCFMSLKNFDGNMSDGGLFTGDQLLKGELKTDQLPPPPSRRHPDWEHIVLAVCVGLVEDRNPASALEAGFLAPEKAEHLASEDIQHVEPEKTRFPKQKPGFETLLGPDTLDVYLNEMAYWKNVPRQVWEYTLGGYQVLKKWLSYREKSILGRGLRIEEVAHVRDTARRIAALLLLGPQLDANYAATTASGYTWPR